MKQKNVVLVAVVALSVAVVVISWWSSDRSPLERRVTNDAGSSSPTEVRESAPPRLQVPDVQQVPSSRPADPPRAAIQEAVESPAAKLARLTKAMQDLATTEKWAELYAAFSRKELNEERAKLEQSIVAGTSDFLERQFETGHVEVLDEQAARTEEPNPFEIRWVRFEDGQPTRVCVAPESDFGDAYKMRALSVWMSQRQWSLAADAARR